MLANSGAAVSPELLVGTFEEVLERASEYNKANDAKNAAALLGALTGPFVAQV
jgi:hypothetical protein